jgi:predicted DNA-binding transcriptional regulator YafY
VALTNAAQACRRVALRYRDQHGEESVRHFDPYGLALRHGRWYVAGMCHLRQALRTFRLDRIADVADAAGRGVRAPARLRPDGACDPGAWPRLPRAYAIEVLLKGDLAAVQAHLFAEAGVLEDTAGRRGDPRPVR